MVWGCGLDSFGDSILTVFINALPGNSSVNTVQNSTIDEAVFSMSSAPRSGGTTGLCNPLLGNGSLKIFLRIWPCYESGDVANNRGWIWLIWRHFRYRVCHNVGNYGEVRICGRYLNTRSTKPTWSDRGSNSVIAVRSWFLIMLEQNAFTH
jgi:WD40 repeat protein